MPCRAFDRHFKVEVASPTIVPNVCWEICQDVLSRIISVAVPGVTLLNGSGDSCGPSWRAFARRVCYSSSSSASSVWLMMWSNAFCAAYATWSRSSREKLSESWNSPSSSVYTRVMVTLNHSPFLLLFFQSFATTPRPALIRIGFLFFCFAIFSSSVRKCFVVHSPRPMDTEHFRGGTTRAWRPKRPAAKLAGE